MESTETYKATRTGGEAATRLVSEFWKQLIMIFRNWGKEFFSMLKIFKEDMKSKDRFRKFAAIFAFSMIVSWSILIPAWDVSSWIKTSIKNFYLTYGEFPDWNQNEVALSVKKFTEEYSASFASNCEWFKTHDVDIEMWRNNRHLRRDSYFCVGFDKFRRSKLFPINIGDPVQDNEITYLDVLIGRVDYNQSKAERYTTIQTRLWRLNDEKDWRIDDMKNVQHADL